MAKSIVFDIKPLPRLRDEPKPNFIPSNMPGSNMLIIAPSNSGKSVLINNLLMTNRAKILREYKTIYVFSPSIEMDEAWDMLRAYRPKKREAKVILDTDYSDSKLNDIFEEQLAMEESERTKTLIIADDIVDKLKGRTDTLEKIFMRARHLKLFMWLSSQLYKRVPRGIRTQSPSYLFFGVNQNELESIRSELNKYHKSKEFDKIFRRCTDAKYSFMFIDDRNEKETRYQCNFSNEYVF